MAILVGQHTTSRRQILVTPSKFDSQDRGPVAWIASYQFRYPYPKKILKDPKSLKTHGCRVVRYMAPPKSSCHNKSPDPRQRLQAALDDHQSPGHWKSGRI